ncbi:MAG: Zn-ribbon domain-containing OB-fold protein [Terriglobia bacterium]
MAGEPQKVRGTPLSGTESKKGKAFVTSYVPRLEYAWDTGEAIGRYLEELRNGRLVGRRCHRCRRTLIPPRMFCERCFRATDEWVRVKDTGTVNTFSLCYVSWDVRRLKQPEIPAVIEIDGAAAGTGIMHVLGNVKPRDVYVGMRVRAVWKPAAERSGSITDILHFEPQPGQRVGKAPKSKKKPARHKKSGRSRR